jgi:hypothetical protein
VSSGAAGDSFQISIRIFSLVETFLGFFFEKSFLVDLLTWFPRTYDRTYRSLVLPLHRAWAKLQEGKTPFSLLWITKSMQNPIDSSNTPNAAPDATALGTGAATGTMLNPTVAGAAGAGAAGAGAGELAVDDDVIDGSDRSTFEFGKVGTKDGAARAGGWGDGVVVEGSAVALVARAAERVTGPAGAVASDDIKGGVVRKNQWSAPVIRRETLTWWEASGVWRSSLRLPHEVRAEEGTEKRRCGDYLLFSMRHNAHGEIKRTAREEHQQLLILLDLDFG